MITNCYVSRDQATIELDWIEMLELVTRRRKMLFVTDKMIYSSIFIEAINACIKMMSIVLFEGFYVNQANNGTILICH
jgi:hypothetical protein